MTRSGTDRGDLYEEVRSLLASKFPDGLISGIKIEEGHGEDGDPILVITAIFEGPTDNFLDAKPAGLLRLVRSKLVEAQDYAFPMLSFVSAEEARA